MKFKGTKLSKRTLALLAAAVIMLGGSGVMGTRAAITVIGPDYDATIQTDQISVALTENGKAIENEAKLYTSLEGKVEPGMTYKDSVGVTNDGQAAEYVRVIVRKYWIEPEKTAKTDATYKLSPALIETDLADESAWIETNGGSDETKIYYLKNQLARGANAVLFNSVRINKSVATARTTSEDKSTDEDGNTKTVITYEYQYNGYTFNVEAEAQSVQTHHAADAMKSVWGVTASMSGDSISSIK